MSTLLPRDAERLMDDRELLLEQGRRAHAAADWSTASAAFGAVEMEQLSADDLRAYFDANWWLGRTDEGARVGAAAYNALLADSRLAEAVKIAAEVAFLHGGRAEEPECMGWIGRAKRVAEAVPDGPAHGYLLFLAEVFFPLLGDDPAAALAPARRMQELGRSFGDLDLVALGLNSEGRGLIGMGNVVDGMALLDESMVEVLDGGVGPYWSGNLYCFTLISCQQVADIGRMARWTELAERWVDKWPAADLYDHLCRVYRAELQLLRGELDAAQSSALRSIEALDGHAVPYSGDAWYVVAEVRRLRGDPNAGQAYDEAHARGHDTQPGRALLLLQQGDVEGAATSVLSALTAAGSDRLRRAPICAAAVEITIASNRLEDAAAAASELAETAETYGTSGLKAMAAGANGQLMLARAKFAEALPVLRDACRRWLELGCEHHAAATHRWLARAYRALGDETSAVAEEARAHEIDERLGAQRGRPGPYGGLTGRECEVLALVAQGRSNREIGEELFISDRTVARHLTNIFHKIGVANRTEAARYAIGHRIAPAR